MIPFTEDEIKKVMELTKNQDYISEEDVSPELLQKMIDEGLITEIDGEEEEENTDELEDIEDEDFSIHDQMDLLSLQEEIKRIEIQENPTSVVSLETKKSDLYKTCMEKAETIGAMFQTLSGFGLDYNNALGIATSIIKDEQEMKLAKIATIG